MEIGPLATRAVLTITESDSLRDAATWMMERGVGSAVVMTDGQPVGIITDRDALKAVAQDAGGAALPVSTYLTRRVTTAKESVELVDAARIMRDKGFRHLLVVDDGGSLVGVFSMRDLVVGLLQELAARPTQ